MRHRPADIRLVLPVQACPRPSGRIETSSDVNEDKISNGAGQGGQRLVDACPVAATYRRIEMALPPQGVDIVHRRAAQGQRHVVVENPGDAGEADKGLSRFLG